MSDTGKLTEVTLVLQGSNAGKDITLAGHKFEKGKLTLKGSEEEVRGAARYLGRCYQALPEGAKQDAWGEEIETGKSVKK